LSPDVFQEHLELIKKSNLLITIIIDESI
jgi:hypothetical protein